MRCIPEEYASLNNMSGLCTHILSAVSCVCFSRVRYMLSSSSPCKIVYVFLKTLRSFKLLPLQDFPCATQFFSWVLQNNTPRLEKCLVRGLAPCPISQKKFMAHRLATTSLRDSPVNKTAKQPCLKYAVSSNKASNSTKR